MNSGPDRTLCLGVMAKYWEPGSVKTRLGASVGMRRSARLHRLFCGHLAVQLAESADTRSFVVTPTDRRSEFERLLPSGWGIEFQCDGDLGDRIRGWFQGGRAKENRVLIGADCPLLNDETIRQSRLALDANDVVIGPARDGGYYLIGLQGDWRPSYATLFSEMPWSGDRVFDETCCRAEAAGLTVATLQPMEDVDTIEELERLRSTLAQSAKSGGRQTLSEAVEREMASQEMTEGEQL